MCGLHLGGRNDKKKFYCIMRVQSFLFVWIKLQFELLQLQLPVTPDESLQDTCMHMYVYVYKSYKVYCVYVCDCLCMCSRCLFFVRLKMHFLRIYMLGHKNLKLHFKLDDDDDDEQTTWDDVPLCSMVGSVATQEWQRIPNRTQRIQIQCIPKWS